jgi:hypothetical protein
MDRESFVNHVAEAMEGQTQAVKEATLLNAIFITLLDIKDLLKQKNVQP